MLVSTAKQKPITCIITARWSSNYIGIHKYKVNTGGSQVTCPSQQNELFYFM